MKMNNEGISTLWLL